MAEERSYTSPPAPSEDYLRMLDTTHTQQLQSRINYTALLGDPSGHDTASGGGNDGGGGDDGAGGAG